MTPGGNPLKSEGERGQSTVEFALVLPLVLLMLLSLLQVGIMLRDQLLVSAAARESAREAAVTADPARIEAAGRRAAPGLSLSLDIDRGRSRGDSVTVKVSAKPLRVPLVGALVADRILRAEATMRVERAA